MKYWVGLTRGLGQAPFSVMTDDTTFPSIPVGGKLILADNSAYVVQDFYYHFSADNAGTNWCQTMLIVSEAAAVVSNEAVGSTTVRDHPVPWPWNHQWTKHREIGE